MQTSSFLTIGGIVAVLLIATLIRLAGHLRLQGSFIIEKSDSSSVRFAGAWVSTAMAVVLVLLVARNALMAVANLADQRIHVESAKRADSDRNLFRSNPSESSQNRWNSRHRGAAFE